MKKYLLVLLLIILIAPSVAFASWWNPFSWNWKTLFNSPVKNEIQTVNPVTNPVINTEPIKSDAKIISPKTKDTPKNIPSVDNSASLKSATQAKIEAELKAKEEQDTLIAKQKAEQDVLLAKQKEEAQKEAQKIQQEKIIQLSAETSRLNELLKQGEDLRQEYNNKVSDLNQQIIDIKNQYYSDFAGEASSAIPLEFVQARQQKLLNDANIKIAKLNLQIQQLTLDYNNKINQLK